MVKLDSYIDYNGYSDAVMVLLCLLAVIVRRTNHMTTSITALSVTLGYARIAVRGWSTGCRGVNTLS